MITSATYALGSDVVCIIFWPLSAPWCVTPFPDYNTKVQVQGPTFVRLDPGTPAAYIPPASSIFIYPEETHPGTVPLYELVSPLEPSSERKKFLYTISLDAGLKNAGYRVVGIAGYVYPNDVVPPDTVPLNRYFNINTGDNAYTILRDDSSWAAYGYEFKGIEGNVFDRNTVGSVPLFVYEIMETYIHFYSIHPTEIYQFASECMRPFHDPSPKGSDGCLEAKP